jgi:splicing factor U2AF subunit
VKSNIKGFAFAEYADSQATEMAIAGLNHFELGDRTLTVSRADVSRSSNSIAGMGMVAQSILAQTSTSAGRAPPPASRVMLLLNMVTTDELRDDEEYAEILEDIKEEAGKFGELDDGPMGGVRIPRPQKKDKKWNAHITGAAIEARNRMLDEQNGVGRVYVKYKDARSTQKGMEALGGRQFGGRTILVASVPEVSFSGNLVRLGLHISYLPGEFKMLMTQRDFDRPEEKAPIADIEAAPNGAENGAAEPAPPPPPPVDMDQAAADALKDIMG